MRILVTGATGQLGRTLVPRLVEKGHALTLLVRDAEKAARLFPGCELAVGDVVLPGLGLERPHRPDAVWHMAADINLGKARDARVWAVNYQGTVNAVDFCLRNSVPRLVYAGTAYTEKGRNVYEKSKKAAEAFVEAAAVRHKTIYKIGILVPPPAEAAAGGEGALYQFVNGFAALAARAGSLGTPFRIKGLPGARLNLVHTDVAAGFMAGNTAAGKFWLTHPDPVKLSDLADWVGAALGAGVRFEPEFRMTRAEALFHRLSGAFLPYLLGDDFPSHLPGIPRVSERFIKESVAASAAMAAGRAGAGGGAC